MKHACSQTKLQNIPEHFLKSLNPRIFLNTFSTTSGNFRKLTKNCRNVTETSGNFQKLSKPLKTFFKNVSIKSDFF